MKMNMEFKKIHGVGTDKKQYIFRPHINKRIRLKCQNIQLFSFEM